MKIKVLLSVIAIMLCNCYVFGQTNDLTQEDMEQLLRQTQLKVNQFNGYIAFIAKKERYKSQQQQAEVERNKDEYIKQALKLFIGGGKDYVDEYGNTCPAPIMQVSRIMRNGKVDIIDRKISDYLVRLKNLRYSYVKVTAGDAFFCSDARQVGENKYVATLSFRQYFVGKNGEVTITSDITDKTVTVYIEKKVIDGRSMWTVLLGDIKVDATEPNYY